MSGLPLSQSAAVAGVVGKIPARGDFLTGLAPSSAAGPLERWIEKGVARARRRYGARFGEVWAVAPIWRFAARGGVFGPSALAGTLCPSVDRAGREFPLVLMAVLAVDADPLDVLNQGAAWFAAAEEIALAALDGDLAPEEIAAALAGSEPPSAATAGRPPGTGGPWPLRVASDGGATLPEGLELALPDSAWITVGGALAQPRGMALAGMPGPDFFADLLRDAEDAADG